MSEPTREELLAQIEELKQKAEGRKKGALEFRVGEKGGVSVYGLGRFPVTLYYEQWVRSAGYGQGSCANFWKRTSINLKLKDS